MHLVFDGTPLCGQPGGIGQYTRGLAEAIARARPTWSLTLLAPYEPSISLDAPNIRVDLVAARSKTKHARGWRQWWFDAVLPGALREVRADVFWAADGMVPVLVRGPRIALTVYDFVPLRWPSTMMFLPRHYRRFNHAVWLGSADWILPISRSVAKELAQLHGHGRSTVVYPGIDEIFRDQRKPRGQASNYFVALGAVEPRKNLAALLRCVIALADEGSWPDGVRVRVVGAKGWRDAKTLALMSKAESRGLVERLGYLPRAQLPRLLADARALLMPSLYEGFGMPIAEALAASCPVICSDIPPFREIADGIEGVRFHATQYDAMLAAYRDALPVPMPPVPSRPPGLERFSWDQSARVFVETVDSA